MRDLLVIEPRWLAELVPHYYEYKAAKTDGARLLQLLPSRESARACAHSGEGARADRGGAQARGAQLHRHHHYRGWAVARPPPASSSLTRCARVRSFAEEGRTVKHRKLF
jgi:hypothetical protein